MFDNIWAPGSRDPAENLAFSGYTCRQEQIEYAIGRFIESVDPDDPATQQRIFEAAGLDSDSLTTEEAEYIVREVVKVREAE